MIAVVTGGRTFRDREMVREVLKWVDGQGGWLLVTGGATGLDILAFDVWTGEFGRPAIKVPAEWRRFGKSAGHRRNRIMLEGLWHPNPFVTGDGTFHYPSADILIAFPGGRGTANCVQQAEQLGVPIVFAVDLAGRGQNRN